MSLTGRGRPRWMAAADRRPQMAATGSSPGSTGTPDSQLASSSRRRTPQWTDLGPFGQLAEGHEGDQRFTADQAGCQRTGELGPVQQRGDIGVQDGRVHGTHQARSRWRSAYVKARNSSSSSSDSKVSAARSSGDRMGPVFLAASNCAADRRGRITAPAELSAPDVLTETSTGSVYLAAIQHRPSLRHEAGLLAS